MSERLQELPPPLGRHNSNSKQDAEGGFSFPQDMDTDAAGPSKVSPVQAYAPLRWKQFFGLQACTLHQKHAKLGNIAGIIVFRK